jgi:hypothetical protein
MKRIALIASLIAAAALFAQPAAAGVSSFTLPDGSVPVVWLSCSSQASLGGHGIAYQYQGASSSYHVYHRFYISNHSTGAAGWTAWQYMAPATLVSNLQLNSGSGWISVYTQFAALIDGQWRYGGEWNVFADGSYHCFA